MTDFHDVDYWTKRFESERKFEWLINSAQFMSVLLPFCNAKLKILNLGSGTSDLQIHLRAKGLLVTNIDFSETAIRCGREAELAAFGDCCMEHKVADVTCLPMFDHLFDLVVDKSTADAVACAGDDALLRMAHSVRGIMSNRATWISCSYSETRYQGIGTIPFHVELLQRFPRPKSTVHEPTLYIWVYKLTPL